MSISLTIGNQNPLSLSGLADLENAATMSNLQLGAEFEKFLAQPLSALPPNFSSTGMQYTGTAPAWTPGVGPVCPPLTFTLTGGVCGSVSVLTSGALLTYTDGLPQTVSADRSAPTPNANTTQTISVQPGQAFVVLEMRFQVSGGVTANYQQGIYGVNTSDSAGATMKVAFYKSCAPATTLQQAVVQAFQGFVLPLHEKTLERISAGDYLHHNLNANLHLSLGASIGYDKVFYAGTTTQTIPDTATAITVTAAVKPEVQAGTKFCASYDYAGTFEILLSVDASRKASLHLYRSEVQDTKVGNTVGLMLTAGTSVSVSTSLSKVTSLLTNSMPAPLQSACSAMIGSASGELDKYVGELNAKLTSWLAHANNQNATLGTAIENTRSKFLLTDYTIDLANASYAGAWNLMLAGDFFKAMDTSGSGVTLATGSGVEALFNTAASIKLNLFGKFDAAWTAETFSNSQLIYAGNNVFHLVTVEGKDFKTVIDATSKEITFYFAAEADVSTAGSPIPAPKLHCILQAANNAKFGAAIGQLVGLLSSAPGVAALAQNVAATAKQAHSTETLHLMFGPDAYGSLGASVMEHGKPDDESKDATNYAAFENACASVFPTQPASFTWDNQPLNYALWRDAWIASNDEWPAPDGSVPNRRESGGCNPSAQAQLGEALQGVNDGTAAQIFYALSAAAQFMNLCDDLRTLATKNVTYNPGTWTSFVQELKNIIHNDLNTDFMPATMLALAQVCGGAPSLVSGPVAGLPVGSSVGVTMRYGQAG